MAHKEKQMENLMKSINEQPVNKPEATLLIVEIARSMIKKECDPSQAPVQET